MKYLVLFILIVSLCSACVLWMWIHAHLKYAFIRSMLLKKYAPICKQSRLSPFADEIFELVLLAVKHAPVKLKQQIIDDLKNNRISELNKYLKHYEKPLFFALCALSKPNYNIQTNRLSARSAFSKLALGLLFENNFEYHRIPSVLSDSSVWPLYQTVRWVRKVLYVRILMYQTDMRRAANLCVKLLKTFQKCHRAPETAYMCFMLGDIYRYAQNDTVAHMMYDNAARLFHKTGDVGARHLVLHTFGLNYLSQKKFDDALPYFEQARRFCTKYQDIIGEAGALNGQAICFHFKNMPQKSSGFAKKAFKKYKQYKHSEGMACSLQLKAINACYAGQSQQAVCCAKEAMMLYRRIQNFASELEVLYLLSQIHLISGLKKNAQKTFELFVRKQEQYGIRFEQERIDTLKNEINLKKV